jgi:ABC-type phosphate transport system auxiliary subunit
MQKGKRGIDATIDDASPWIWISKCSSSCSEISIRRQPIHVTNAFNLSI